MLNSNSSPTNTGNFSVAFGQIIDPNGNVFIAKGIDIANLGAGAVFSSATAAQVTALLPGINFVRFPVNGQVDGWPSAASLQSFVEAYTQAGIVIEIEDHPWPQVPSYTGQDLVTESNWYASLAATFANNPYVWFGTMNEPQNGYGADEANISAQQLATYQAIRGAGNNTIIMMESGVGGGNPGTIGANFGFVASDYAAMTGIVWDFHFYSWVNNASLDQATVTASLLGDAASGIGIAADGTITSADGAIPVIIGEYGPSIYPTSADANWPLQFNAVQNCGCSGSAAWGWDPGSNSLAVQNIVDDSGNITPYGQQIQQYIGAKP